MSYDYTWIENSRYAKAVADDRNASRRMSAADSLVADAKARIQKIDSNTAYQTTLDQQYLERSLEKEAGRLSREFSQFVKDTEQEVSGFMARQEQKVEQARRELLQIGGKVEDLSDKITKISQEFNQGIKDILDKTESEGARARLYHAQLDQLLNEVHTLHPEKLTPGEAELLFEGLAFSETDINNGDYQAAIGIVQTQLPSAYELKTRLEFLNDEYAQLIVRIRDCCELLENRITNIRIPEKNSCLLDLNDENSYFDGRIDFWTNGVFEVLAEKIVNIRSTVENDFMISMDIDALRQALNELLTMDEKLDACINFAHHEFREFLDVQLLAIKINNSLTEDDDWQIVNSGFINDDQRRSFAITYINTNGLTCSIVVIPNKETRDKTGRVTYGGTQFSVDVSGRDIGYNYELCQITKNGIIARLNESEINTGDAIDVHTPPTETVNTIRDSTISKGDRFKNERVSRLRASVL